MDKFIEAPIILALVIGFILDTLVGDPHKLPHPIRVFGAAISFAEKRFNKNTRKKLKGFIVASFLISLTWIVFFILFKLLETKHELYIVVASIGVFYGIANRSLIQEAYKVERNLHKGKIEDARLQLSYIVGRETKTLNPQQIRAAILETLAENLSDGIIAPLFYYAIVGVPLLFTYKMVNTLDSMIGYKNKKYKDFGWFAAKTDDLFNFIPARITAFLMVLITLSKKGFINIFKYGNKHSSPNAGYPEAALSGIFNIQLGGPNMYHGKMVDKPFIGSNNRELKHLDIVKACILNFLVTLTTVVLIIVTKLFF